MFLEQPVNLYHGIEIVTTTIGVTKVADDVEVIRY